MTVVGWIKFSSIFKPCTCPTVIANACCIIGGGVVTMSRAYWYGRAHTKVRSSSLRFWWLSLSHLSFMPPVSDMDSIELRYLRICPKLEIFPLSPCLFIVAVNTIRRNFYTYEPASCVFCVFSTNISAKSFIPLFMMFCVCSVRTCTAFSKHHGQTDTNKLPRLFK